MLLAFECNKCYTEFVKPFETVLLEFDTGSIYIFESCSLIIQIDKTKS